MTFHFNPIRSERSLDAMIQIAEKFDALFIVCADGSVIYQVDDSEVGRQIVEALMDNNCIDCILEWEV